MYSFPEDGNKCLCPQYKDGKKLKPKPNYNSVDMSEVEWEDTEETVNTSTIQLYNYVGMKPFR